MSRVRSSEDIASIVLRLRKKLDLDGNTPFEGKLTLERMKQHFLDFNYEEIPDNELTDAEGMYDPRVNTIFFPERAFKRLDSGDPRINFSVAHELAHYVLNHQAIRFRRAEKKLYERAAPNIQREEREANQFAAFLLAPDALCNDCKSVLDFMLKFGLSRHAAEIRKEEYDRHLRRITGQPRPLTPNVIDLLQHLRSKGNNVKILEDPVRPRQLAPLSVARQQAHGAITQERRSRYMAGVCTVCRNTTVFPLGHKFKCDTCHTVFDQFQDGDIVDV
jgi:Zn-dependent peptidase ImmA (M78 family)